MDTRTRSVPARRRVGYAWRLRQLMSAHGMVATTELLEPLAVRGIRLSTVAVWRLVEDEPPKRLSMPILAALCDIFECSPCELIHTFAEASEMDIEERSADNFCRQHVRT